MDRRKGVAQKHAAYGLQPITYPWKASAGESGLPDDTAALAANGESVALIRAAPPGLASSMPAPQDRVASRHAALDTDSPFPFVGPFPFR